MPLSVCMIAKNEEAWIGDCIRHLQPIADEIIVVDTGSTDATKKIANDLGARIFDFKWINDFSAARNFSLEQATKDWILVIDPDERLCAKDLLEFKKLTQDKSAQAYAFYCRNYVRNPKIIGFKKCEGEYALEERDYPGYVENSKVFLFKNLPHIRFTGVVHENVVECVKDDLIASDIPFHHYGYSPEVNAVKNKRDLYRTLGEEKLKMDSNNWYAHFELGVEYLTGGKTEQALALFERANELQPNELRVLSHLAATYFKLNKLVEAENFIMKCLGLDQNHLESAIRLSAIWIRQGHLEKADKLLGKLQSDFRPNYLVYKNSALCAAQMKNPEKSILYFRKALSEFPDVFDCWTDFVFQLLHSGKNTEAFEMIKLALSKVGEEKSLLRLGFEIALRMEAFADAETFIKAYLKQEPADVYAKSHLTTALVYQGKFDEVLTAAEAVFASEPKNFTANFNCALSLYETKNWAKAKNHFELALQVNPNDKNIQEALKQISTYLN